MGKNSLVANNIDPSETKKTEKAENAKRLENEKRINAGLPILNSFEHIANDWLNSIAHEVRDITHKKKIRRLELHVFPNIGSMAINEVKSPDIYRLFRFQ